LFAPIRKKIVDRLGEWIRRDKPRLALGPKERWGSQMNLPYIIALDKVAAQPGGRLQAVAASEAVTCRESAMSDAVKGALDRLEKSGRLRPFFMAVRRDFFKRARYLFPWCLEADLDDSLQEALLSAFSRPESLIISEADTANGERFEQILSAYVRAAARNQLISRLRIIGRDSVRLESLQELMEDSASLDKHLFEQGEAIQGSDFAVHLIRKREIVERCIEKLSELARTTFMLALSGHKDVEIQKLTNSGSAVAVRRRISETRTRVVECVNAATGERM
jgi:DNA-directed RNA polymerase specialized sigma24 family protein